MTKFLDSVTVPNATVRTSVAIGGLTSPFVGPGHNVVSHNISSVCSSNDLTTTLVNVGPGSFNLINLDEDPALYTGPFSLSVVYTNPSPGMWSDVYVTLYCDVAYDWSTAGFGSIQLTTFIANYDRTAPNKYIISDIQATTLPFSNTWTMMKFLCSPDFVCLTSVGTYF